jgi:hypothetical protein
MKKQGIAVIWGIGTILALIGTLLVFMSIREMVDGLRGLALIEIILSIILFVFSALSFYITNK